VDIPEMLPLSEIIEIDFPYLVDDLAHRLARFHVIVGVLKNASNNCALFSAQSHDLETFQSWKQVRVDKFKERVTGNPLWIGSPVPPASAFRDRRDVFSVKQLTLLVLVVDDLQKEHPAELRNALSIAIHACILSHEILNSLNCVSN